MHISNKDTFLEGSEDLRKITVTGNEAQLQKAQELIIKHVSNYSSKYSKEYEKEYVSGDSIENMST